MGCAQTLERLACPSVTGPQFKQTTKKAQGAQGYGQSWARSRHFGTDVGTESVERMSASDGGRSSCPGCVPETDPKDAAWRAQNLLTVNGHRLAFDGILLSMRCH